MVNIKKWSNNQIFNWSAMLMNMGMIGILFNPTNKFKNISKYLNKYYNIRVNIALFNMILNTLNIIRAPKKLVNYSGTENIQHIIVISIYKEPENVLIRTLETIKLHPKSTNYIIHLALEDRDPTALQLFENIKKKYGDYFKKIQHTIHILKEGELAGKSSNENFAVRNIYKDYGQNLNVLITCCDVDTYFHKNYFETISHRFIKSSEDKKFRTIWQAPVFHYGNYNEIKDIIVKTRISLVSMGFLSICNDQFSPLVVESAPFSTYTLSLNLIHKSDYWDPSIIGEDFDIYLRANGAYKNKKIIMDFLMLPTLCDVPINTGGWKNLYDQSKRWKLGFSSLRSLLSLDTGIRNKSKVAYNFFQANTQFIFICYAIKIFLEKKIIKLLISAHLIIVLDIINRQHINISSWSKKELSHLLKASITIPIAEFIFNLMPTMHSWIELGLNKKIEYVKSIKS